MIPTGLIQRVVQRKSDSRINGAMNKATDVIVSDIREYLGEVVAQNEPELLEQVMSMDLTDISSLVSEFLVLNQAHNRLNVELSINGIQEAITDIIGMLQNNESLIQWAENWAESIEWDAQRISDIVHRRIEENL